MRYSAVNMLIGLELDHFLSTICIPEGDFLGI
jgi:hypothetical protein